MHRRPNVLINTLNALTKGSWGSGTAGDEENYERVFYFCP
jgi:hypothetical protein